MPREIQLQGNTVSRFTFTKLSHMTPDGDSVSSRDIVKVDLEGMGLPVSESTLNTPQEIHEVGTDRLLDHYVVSVYQLTVEELDPELEEKLKAGSVFETSFAYRRGSTPQAAFLINNGEGYFLLVSKPHNFQFCAPDQQVTEMDTEDDPFTDDFDFGMMG